MTKEEFLRKKEEHIKLFKEHLHIKLYGVLMLLNEVQADIVNNIKKGERRFEKLQKAIDQKYPSNTVPRGYIDGLSYFLMRNAFELYFIGNNAALFVELQGLLERTCIDRARSFLAVNVDTQTLLQDSFKKKVLTDIAPYFKNISLWDDENVKFANKLTQIRNGVAHKNITLLSKHLGNGQATSMSEIIPLTQKSDMILFIIKTIEFLVKVSDVKIPAMIKNLRFEARYKAYSIIIGSMVNLHGELLLIGLPEEVEIVSLNQLYTPVCLLASKETSSVLEEYKQSVLEFHKYLNVDDDKTRIIHEKLQEQLDKCCQHMRSDLNVDADIKVFVAKQLETMEKVKAFLEKRKKTIQSESL